MKKISNILTVYLLKNDIISQSQYNIYQFGFQVGLEFVVCIGLCFIISIQMHMIHLFVAFWLIFFSLRSHVGGLHMKSYGTCLVFSCLSFWMVLVLTKYCILSPQMCIFIFSLDFLILFFIKPVENDNRNVTIEEKKVYGRRIKRILLLLACIFIYLYLVDSFEFIRVILFTLLLIIFSLITGKIYEGKHIGSIRN